MEGENKQEEGEHKGTKITDGIWWVDTDNKDTERVIETGKLGVCKIVAVETKRTVLTYRYYVDGPIQGKEQLILEFSDWMLPKHDIMVNFTDMKLEPASVKWGECWLKQKRMEYEVYKKIVINELEQAKENKTIMSSKLKKWENIYSPFYKLKESVEHQYNTSHNSYNNSPNMAKIQVCSQHKDKVFYDSNRGGNWQPGPDGKNFVKDICNEKCVEFNENLWKETIQSYIDRIKNENAFQSYLQSKHLNAKEAAIYYLRFQTGSLYIDWNDEKK